MDLDELKIEVINTLEKKMTMRQQVDFANFCKSEVQRLLSSYIDAGHENARKSLSSGERETHHKEIHYVGEMFAQLN